MSTPAVVAVTIRNEKSWQVARCRLGMGVNFLVVPKDDNRETFFRENSTNLPCCVCLVAGETLLAEEGM